jgi:hypothetical protein
VTSTPQNKRPAGLFGAYIVAVPELHIAVFSFLLNFVWEMLQVPFFTGMTTIPHWQGVKECTFATGGDVLISLICFWFVATIVRSRQWLHICSWKHIGLFLLPGLIITVGLEFLATNVLGRWTYAENMPVLPLLGTGLIPLLQWIVIPFLLLWLARLQTLGWQMFHP